MKNTGLVLAGAALAGAKARLQKDLSRRLSRRQLKKQEQVRQFQERLQLWQDKSKSLKSARMLKLAEDRKLLSFQAAREQQDIEKVFRQKQLKMK